MRTEEKWFAFLTPYLRCCKYKLCEYIMEFANSPWPKILHSFEMNEASYLICRLFNSFEILFETIIIYFLRQNWSHNLENNWITYFPLITIYGHEFFRNQKWIIKYVIQNFHCSFVNRSDSLPYKNYESFPVSPIDFIEFSQM